MSRRTKTAKGAARNQQRAAGVGEDQSPAGGDRRKIRDVFVARPFEGLVDESCWIALRELVPAATAPLTLAPEYAERFPGRTVSLATILPLALPVLNRTDGAVVVGLQCHHHSGDLSRDYAAAILAALSVDPGARVDLPALPGPGPRLQDLLVSQSLDVTLHEGFEFWFDGDPTVAEDPKVRDSLDRANASMYPTSRIKDVPSAFWCRLPERAHVRWVLGEDEDRAMEALARVSAAGALPLGEGTRFAGMFRAHGRIIPVWDLPADPDADAWDESMRLFAERYSRALAVDGPLTPQERRARQGLLGRQIALR